jgi:acetyl-CoA acetyltransferase
VGLPSGTGRAASVDACRAGLTIDNIDAFEVNEAFASVVLAWLTETGADPAKVNINGGAPPSATRSAPAQPG